MSKNRNLKQHRAESGNFERLMLIIEKIVILIKNGATVTEEDKAELESHVSKLTT